MKAARFWAPRDVRVEDVAEPEPGPGEIVVAIEAALTCGTDAKCYRRGHPVLLGPSPARFGHEYAGVVAAAGEGAPFAVGDARVRRQLGALRRLPAVRDRARGAVRRSLPAAQRRLRRAAARARAHRAHEPARDPARRRRREVRRRSSRWPARCTAPRTPGRRPACTSASSAAARSAACSRSPAAPAARRATLLGRGEGAPRSYDAVIEAAGTRRGLGAAPSALAAPGRRRSCCSAACRAGRVLEIGTLPLHYEALTLRGCVPPPPARRARRRSALLARATRRRSPTLLTHEFALDDVVEPLRAQRGPRAARRAAQGGDPPVRIFASQLRRLPVSDPAGEPSGACATSS